MLRLKVTVIFETSARPTWIVDRRNRKHETWDRQMKIIAHCFELHCPSNCP
jgi:hypothetical protein